MTEDNNWQRCEIKKFWGDVASGEHIVQLYENDTILLNTLSDFSVDGFYAGDSVVIIATGKHLEALNSRLRIRGLNLGPLIAADQYIALDADETLAKFMVNGHPDENYFTETIAGVMRRASKNGRRVRAFGEMVVLLWERGNSNATLELEHLWNNYCSSQTLSLLCAYPKSSFANDATAAVMHICSAHAKLIDSDQKYPSEISYRAVRA